VREWTTYSYSHKLNRFDVQASFGALPLTEAIVTQFLIALLAALLVAVGQPTGAHAFDADDCTSALESLRDAAGSAADDADDAERDCRDCDDCRDDEDRDDCHWQCEECADRKRRVKSELSSVESALFSVQLSCDYRFETDPARALEKARRRVEEMKKQFPPQRKPGQ
jgi:hypothetical protein